MRAVEIGTAWLDAAEKSAGASKAVYLERARNWLGQVSGLSKNMSARLQGRLKKVDGDIRRTVGTAFVKRHPLRAIAYNGHWYQFVAEPTSWHQARQQCEDRGGYLVCIESPAECQWIYQLAAAQFVPGNKATCWIGATEEGHDRLFTWVNGAAMQFADWSNKEPTPETIGEVVLIERTGKSGEFKWFDAAITNNYPFICEWDR